MDFICVGTGSPDIIKTVHAIKRTGVKINLLGFLDDNSVNSTRELYGFPFLGGISELKKKSSSVAVFNSVFRNCEVREKVHTKLNRFTENYINLIHPSADIDGAVIFGSGVYIASGVRLGMGASVGSHSMIMDNATIAHDTSIGNCCFLGAGAHIQGHVIVEDKVFIGSGAVVCPSLRIGSNSVIGVNSAVMRSVPKSSITFSEPARVIKNEKRNG